MSREWEGSTVMSEFLKIASESGLISSDLDHKDGIGNPTKDTPVKDHRRYEPTEEYDVKTEPADMIEKAHPNEAWMSEKSTPVDSMGNGSLVENVKEQQKKDIEIATKMPHGTLIGIHAQLINELVKMANQLEDEGKIKQATRIDETIKKISSCHKLKKESAWWLIPALIAGGVTGAKMFGSKFTSMQENLVTDAKDLYEELLDKSDVSNSIRAAGQLIEPFVTKLESVDLSTKQGSDEYAKIIANLGPVTIRLNLLMLKAKQDVKEPSDFLSKMWSEVRNVFGFSDYNLIEAKFKDFMDSYKEAKKYVIAAKNAEQQLAQKNEIGGNFKNSSINTTFMGQKYESLEDLQEALNSALENLYISGKTKKQLKVKIVENGELTSSPAEVNKLIGIIEEKMRS